MIRMKTFLAILLGLTAAAKDVSAALVPADKAELAIPTNPISNGGFERGKTGWMVYSDSANFFPGTVDAGADEICINSGWYTVRSGERVAFYNSGGALPAGLTAATVYYMVPTSGTCFKVSATLGGSVVDLTDTGTGTHTARPLQPTNATIATSGVISAGITLTAPTSSPLEGAASGLITKDAAVRTGDGIAYSFTVPRSQWGKLQTLEFDYEVASGTFAYGAEPSTDSDLEVFIVTSTSGPLHLQLLQTAKIMGGGKYSVQWQPPVDANATYYLCVHQTGLGSSAYTLKVDNVKVTPVARSTGPITTDSQAFVPTFTNFGVVTSIDVKRSRRGEFLLMSGKFTTGTTAAAEGRISLPDGLKPNVPALAAGQGFKVGLINDSSASFAGGLYVLAENGVSYLTIGVQDATRTGGTKQNANDVIGSSAIVHFSVEVPIQGWGSNAAMSSEVDGRIVAAGYTSTSTAAVSTVLPATFNTKLYDTHAAFNGTIFTAPSTGYYRVTSGFYTGGAHTPRLYKNGSFLFQGTIGAGNNILKLDGTVQLNAGDTLEIRADSATTLGCGGTGTECFLFVEKVPGPAHILPSDAVAARYTGTTGATGAQSTWFTVVYNTKDYDYTGSFSTSTGVFTVPSPGIYAVTASAYITGDAGTTGCLQRVRKSGTVQIESGTWFKGTPAGGNDCATNVATHVRAVAGDTIDVQFWYNASVNQPLNTSGNFNIITITRVSN